jgi:hypothetical protein
VVLWHCVVQQLGDPDVDGIPKASRLGGQCTTSTGPDQPVTVVGPKTKAVNLPFLTAEVAIKEDDPAIDGYGVSRLGRRRASRTWHDAKAYPLGKRNSALRYPQPSHLAAGEQGLLKSVVSLDADRWSRLSRCDLVH